MRRILFSLLFVCSFLSAEIPEKEIVIVIPSYNNEQWYMYNLLSVLNQRYQNYRIVYVNDCSTDGTAEDVEELARTCVSRSLRVFSFDDTFSDNIPESAEKFKEALNREKVFFTLVNNNSRCGALENLYRMIQSCEGHEIIVTVDGDDWLSDNEVLQRINEAYSSKEIWMTHGKFIEYPSVSYEWNEPVPPELVARNAVRQFKCPSHLRTFYAWIFKKIALQDLLYEGKFFAMAWDMAMMYPMLEMAAERHHFFSEPNYVYNNSNPINDNKVNAELQRQLDGYIRSMKPYKRLENAN